MALKTHLNSFKKSILALSKTQKKCLAFAFGFSILIKFIPITNYLSQSFSLMFHELGHAVTAWSFGHFAVPRFDMINGGGVTDIYKRSFLFSVILFIFLIANILYIKKQANGYAIKKMWIVVFIYLLLFFTELRYSMISFMGKGGELLFCFLLAWYALNQLRTNIHPKAVFYLFLSAMLWINSLEDSVKLIFNEDVKAKYIGGIERTMGGDPLTNDLVKLSDRSGLSIDFFNYLLIFLSFWVLFKIITYAHIAALSKKDIFPYLKNLSGTLLNQVKSTANSRNKKLKGGRREKIRRNKTVKRKHQSKRD